MLLRFFLLCSLEVILAVFFHAWYSNNINIYSSTDKVRRFRVIVKFNNFNSLMATLSIIRIRSFSCFHNATLYDNGLYTFDNNLNIFTHDFFHTFVFLRELVVTTVVWYNIGMPSLVYISWKCTSGTIFAFTNINQLNKYCLVVVLYFQDIHSFSVFSWFLHFYSYNINEELLFLAQLFY